MKKRVGSRERELYGKLRQLRKTRVTITIVLLLCATTLPSHARAQEAGVDLVFRNYPLGWAIESLAESQGKSVAFDRTVQEQRNIVFEVQGVTTSDALAQLLDCERLYAIELGSVLIVVPDMARLRVFYTPQRIAACRIGTSDDKRGDRVLPRGPLEELLTTLARENGRTAVVEKSIAGYSLSREIKLRAVTQSEALQVLCLVAHVAVRDDGEALTFSRYIPGPRYRPLPSPPAQLPVAP